MQDLIGLFSSLKGTFDAEGLMNVLNMEKKYNDDDPIYARTINFKKYQEIYEYIKTMEVYRLTNFTFDVVDSLGITPTKNLSEVQKVFEITDIFHQHILNWNEEKNATEESFNKEYPIQ